MPGGMQFQRPWDFDQGNKPIYLNDLLNPDAEVLAALQAMEGLGGGEVSLDADGTLTVGATTVELATDAELTSAVAGLEGDIGVVDAALTAHTADTTAVHGIADTTVLATDADVAAAVAGISSGMNRYHVSGSWYRPPVPTISTSWAGVGLGSMGMIPFVVYNDGTIDAMGVNVQTAAASSTFRLGIYEDNNGSPGDLLLDAGTVDSSTTGIKTITGLSLAVTRGQVLWLAASPQGTTVTQVQVSSGSPNPELMPGTTSIGSQDHPGYVINSVTGALPASAAGASTNNRVWIPYVRFA